MADRIRLATPAPLAPTPTTVALVTGVRLVQRATQSSKDPCSGASQPLMSACGVRRGSSNLNQAPKTRKQPPARIALLEGMPTCKGPPRANHARRGHTTSCPEEPASRFASVAPRARTMARLAQTPRKTALLVPKDRSAPSTRTSARRARALRLRPTRAWPSVPPATLDPFPTKARPPACPASRVWPRLSVPTRAARATPAGSQRTRAQRESPPKRNKPPEKHNTR